MRNNVVTDQIRSHIGNTFVFRWHANLSITEAKLSLGVCDSDCIFLTEMAAVPSSVSVHREFAEREKFRSQVWANDSFRVFCAASSQPMFSGSPVHLNRFLEYSYRVRSLIYAMPIKEEKFR